MRRNTVKKFSFGDMPIAGYITEIMKKVVDFDGWNVLEFAKQLDEHATALDENGSGELYIMIYSDDMSACYNCIEFCFASDENELNLIVNQYVNEHGSFPIFRDSIILRLFGNDEEYGLEELEVLF